MKNFTVSVILLLAFIQCFSQTAPSPSELKKLQWLEGTWTRTNAKPGRSGSERWVKVSENEWRGWGVSMSGNDTTFVEKLKLVIHDGTICYAADVPENKNIVYFKFTELTDSRFTCENPEHDFPKKIAYERTGNQLKAIVSGDGKSLEYFFEKK
ncbi:MAG TPA: DUF6265 family protein [Cyclobacteriaceae bacterium]|nr:DUF6265 family protein [Cyclobacteriaceae bacterium]